MTFAYTPPTVAGTGPLPGTALLRDLLIDKFGHPVGSYNRRCVRQCGANVATGSRVCTNGHGISHHAESTAVDVMSSDPGVHSAVWTWALSPEGQAWEIQEIVTGFPPVDLDIRGPARWQIGQGWKPYSGPSAHTDHVHLSQTFEAAHRTTPPEEIDMARPYTAVRPINGYPVVILAPEGSFYVLEPKRVDDFVEAKLVNGIEPGQSYDALASKLAWDTFAWRYDAILVRDRGHGLDARDRRPAGEV